MIRPLKGKILIEVEEENLLDISGVPEKRDSLILMPESRTAERFERGRVIAVGEEIFEDIEVGDQLVYVQFKADKFTHDGKPHRLLKEEDISLKYVQT